VSGLWRSRGDGGRSVQGRQGGGCGRGAGHLGVLGVTRGGQGTGGVHWRCTGGTLGKGQEERGDEEMSK
jgi:hypothetical protein